ncbi:MAG: toast rack family protein [Chloroflexota bacterium]
MQETRPHRTGLSIWPAILIGAGVIWLLAQANVITGAHLSVLFRFWPVILIAIGLELLLGRRSPALSTLIGVGAVALIVALVLAGPSLGLAQAQQAQTETIDIPLDDAESAEIQLDVAVGSLRVTPSTDPDKLLEGEVNYFGRLDIAIGDEDGRRFVNLHNEFERTSSFFFNLFTDEDEADWELGLNTGVPVDLIVNTGTGSSELQLADVMLNSLEVHGGTGSITVALPALETPYEVLLDSGTGSINVAIPDRAAVTLRVNTGTGSTAIDVPDGAAVRVSGSVGTGSINVPRGWTRVSGEESRFIGDEGVWQTAGFDTAERQIEIIFHGGTGSLNIR